MSEMKQKGEREEKEAWDNSRSSRENSTTPRHPTYSSQQKGDKEADESDESDESDDSDFDGDFHEDLKNLSAEAFETKHNVSKKRALSYSQQEQQRKRMVADFRILSDEEFAKNYKVSKKEFQQLLQQQQEEAREQRMETDLANLSDEAFYKKYQISKRDVAYETDLANLSDEAFYKKYQISKRDVAYSKQQQQEEAKERQRVYFGKFILGKGPNLHDMMKQYKMDSNNKEDLAKFLNHVKKLFPTFDERNSESWKFELK